MSHPPTGLFDRALSLFEVVGMIEGIPSDAEVEGLLQVLPPDVSNNLSAFFEPHTREAGLPFLDSLRIWLTRAKRARREGRKVILVPFNFPPELVLSFDNAEILTSEVLTTIASIGLQGGGERYWDQMMALGLPDHICSANSVELGSVLTGDFPPDAIISAAPGGCDANSKIHEFVSHQLGIPQFVLEKPVDDTPAGHEQYGIYFRKLIAQLEEFLDEELTEDKLRRQLTGANRCTELYWDIFELIKIKPSPVPALFNLFLAPTRFCSWGNPEGIRTLEAVLEASRKRAEAGAYTAPRERARVLWAYTSYYFDLPGLYSWMEGRGYTFLSDVLDLYAPRPVDLTSYDTMVDGMIESAWDYPMNRQMAAQSMSQAWTADVGHWCKELSADCVVFCGHDACKQTWSVISILREEMMKRHGIPVLVLHGDSWMKTTTPITVIQSDIDEFIDGVVHCRRRGRRRVRRRPADRGGTGG